jgi:ADP-ribose pyrophosphatase YjhB (NUDIX family)
MTRPEGHQLSTTERVLSALSIALSILCLLMGWQILRLRARRAASEETRLEIPRPPERVTAWTAVDDRGDGVALYHLEDSGPLRRAADRTLAEHLGLRGSELTFLELLLVASAQGSITVGDQVEVLVERPDQVDPARGVAVDALAQVSPGELPSGTRLLLTQKGGGGVVPAGRSRKLLMGVQGLLNLEDAGRVTVGLEGQWLELERQDVALGELDQVIRRMLEGAR